MNKKQRITLFFCTIIVNLLFIVSVLINQADNTCSGITNIGVLTENDRIVCEWKSEDDKDTKVEIGVKRDGAYLDKTIITGSENQYEFRRGEDGKGYQIEIKEIEYEE